MTDFQRIERPRLVVTRKLLPAIEARMAELFDCTFNDDDHAMSREELVAAVQNCDILVPTVTDTIDADIIAAAACIVKNDRQFRRWGKPYRSGRRQSKGHIGHQHTGRIHRRHR